MEDKKVEIKDIIDEDGMIVDYSEIEYTTQSHSFMLAVAQNLAPMCLGATKNGYKYRSNTSFEILGNIGTVVCTTNLQFNGLNDLEKYEIILKNNLHVGRPNFKEGLIFESYLDMAVEDLLNEQEANLLEHKAELIGKGKAALDMIEVLGKYMDTLNTAIDAANAANGLN